MIAQCDELNLTAFLRNPYGRPKSISVLLAKPFGCDPLARMRCTCLCRSWRERGQDGGYPVQKSAVLLAGPQTATGCCFSERLLAIYPAPDPIARRWVVRQRGLALASWHRERMPNTLHSAAMEGCLGASACTGLCVEQRCTGHQKEGQASGRPSILVRRARAPADSVICIWTTTEVCPPLLSISMLPV